MILVSIKNYCSTTWYSSRFLWLDTTYILETFTQRDELQRLIHWASRRKLRRVRDHYRRLLDDVEMRLSSQALRHRHLTELAEWLYCLATMLNPSPHVYAKGAAAKYRLRN